jgi:hypothetical protein
VIRYQMVHDSLYTGCREAYVVQDVVCSSLTIRLYFYVSAVSLRMEQDKLLCALNMRSVSGSDITIKIGCCAWKKSKRAA